MAEFAGEFDGDPSDWEEWEWNFKSYLAIFQREAIDFLVRAGTSDVEILDAHFAAALPQQEALEIRTFSRKLHSLSLSQLVYRISKTSGSPECCRKWL